MNRRDFLAVGGVLGVVALAGCPDNGERGPSTGDDVGSDSTGTPGPSYDLDFSVIDDTVDLSDLPTNELDSYDSIRDEDFLELDATVYEELEGDREEADDYELDIQLGDQTVEPEQTDNIYRIACTELETGENDVTVTADVEGETLEQSATVTKQTPDAHLIEAIVDDEQITQYSSPYEFDTHRLDTEEFHQRRQEAAREDAWENAEEYIDTEELNSTDDKKEILQILGQSSVDNYLGENRGGAISAHAEAMAATEQTLLIDNRDDVENTDIYSSGFDNPADRTTEETGNHGSKVHYYDGDWYHQETRSNQTRHISNIETASMVHEDGVNNDFVSVLGEFQEGEMDELNFDTKMSRTGQFYITHSIPDGSVSEGFMVSDPYGSTGLEMIRENTAREEIMAPVEAASDYFLETEKTMSVLGTPGRPVILATNNWDINDRILEEPDFQDVDTVLNEALN